METENRRNRIARKKGDGQIPLEKMHSRLSNPSSVWGTHERISGSESSLRTPKLLTDLRS